MQINLKDLDGDEEFESYTSDLVPVEGDYMRLMDRSYLVAGREVSKESVTLYLYVVEWEDMISAFLNNFMKK